jgi:Ca2+-transporting ATPase
MESGLQVAETARRLAADGPNELIERGGKSPWRILWEQFTATMIVILLVAAALSAVIGDLKDAIAIGVIVLLNGLLGFSQEHQAERAMAALKKLSAPLVRVLRGGKTARIPARELVAGDVILLEAGNLVPADGRLIESASLKVLEAPLTGEAEAVEKTVEPVFAGAALGDRRNMVYKGTTVAHGRGSAIVTETGMRTELGRIAELMQRAGGEPTPLQLRLDRLGNRLAAAALIVVAVVFVMGLSRGEALKTMFMTAVSLAAAAVPEGLPAVVTIALAIGARRMLARRALIRKLPAVETLGSVTVICSDKTGTLTEGRMSVSTIEGPEAALLTAAALCNDATPTEGDPTEVALSAAAEKRGFARVRLEEKMPRSAEAPFDSTRKKMTTVHRLQATAPPGLEWLDGGEAVGFTKGAVEAVLQVCARTAFTGRVEELTPDRRRAILDADARLAEQGSRVLGFAARRHQTVPREASPSTVESDLVFLGLIGISDPPRPEAGDAVARCLQAGIRPVMITGDHPMTALAVAARLGIESPSALTGPELEKMAPDELARRVTEVSVYARVAPEHKLRIVDALRKRGHIVAMTGDGVNDAPALREADIGVAMGITGTDVSKEAADMVLLDDNFATIVAAVEEGRVIYDNIRRFVKYLLTTNSAEVLVMLVTPLFGMPLPLLPLQILWINLVTDGPTSLTLAVEAAERGVMSRPPREPDESLLGRGLGLHALWVGLLMTALTVGVGVWYWKAGDPVWQTMLFTTLALAQMGHVLAIRSETESLFTMGVRGNLWLTGAVAATVLLQLSAVYFPPFGKLLSTQPLHFYDLAVAVGLGAVVFVAVEIEKTLRRERGRRRSVGSGRSRR